MSTVNGLPAHVLLVHAVIVLVPLAALLLVLSAFWPAARRRFAALGAVLAAVALIMVPITTEAGEWLEHHLPRTPLMRAHTHLGDTMLPWAIGLFVVAAVVAVREFLRNRRVASVAESDAVLVAHGPGAATPGRAGTDGFGGRPVTIVLAVLALVVAVGSTVTVVRIGESGARAAWTGNFSDTPVAAPPRQQPPAGG